MKSITAQYPHLLRHSLIYKVSSIVMFFMFVVDERPVAIAPESISPESSIPIGGSSSLTKF